MKRHCGLDVHKDSVFMCIITETGEKIEEVFGTLTPELDRLRDTILGYHVEHAKALIFMVALTPIFKLA